MKSIKNIIFLMIFNLLFGNFLISQENNPFDFCIDFARFRYDSVSSYLEIYYSFSQSKLKLIKQNENLTGSAIFAFKIFLKSNDSLVTVSRWKTPFQVSDTASLNPDKMLTGLKTFAIPFGEYYFIAKITDENNPKISDSLRFELKNNPISKHIVSVSDPELCVSIQQIPKDDKNIFYKNTLETIPNPRLIFGVGLPIIYVYMELYNLDKIKSDNYLFSIDIFTINARRIKSLPKLKKKHFESSVEVSAVNCSDLPSGTYIMRCSVIDENDTTQRAISMKKFYIYNPHLAQSKEIDKISDLNATEYALMNESDINREFQTAKYLANKSELEQFEKITSLDGKRTFITDFWRKRDPDPSTPENELKDKYVKSLQYVNLNFKTGQREGWKTDRGRVFLIYGQPDEFERHPNEIDSKPYEIWYYNNIEGGIIFVFIDRSTMGDYILVHSTYRNEIRDDNWQRLLK